MLIWMPVNILTLYAVTQKDESVRAERFSQAIALYDKYLGMTGDSGITNYYRGKAYFTLNDFEHAVNDFEAAFNAGIEKEDLLSLIGRSYAKLKDYDKAIEILNEYEKVDTEAIIRIMNGRLPMPRSFWSGPTPMPV